jgi:hypothetical protein
LRELPVRNGIKVDLEPGRSALFRAAASLRMQMERRSCKNGGASAGIGTTEGPEQ